MPQSSQQCQGRWWTLVTAAGSAGRGGEGRRRGKRAGPQREAKEGKLNLCVQRTRVTGGIRAMALSLGGGGGTLGQAPGRRWGNSGSQWQRALRFSGATAPTRSSPDGHPNFQRCGPAQRSKRGLTPCVRRGLGSETRYCGRPQKVRSWLRSQRLPGLHGPGVARAATVVVADAGRPLPMG